MNAGGVSNKYPIDQIDEKATFDHTGDTPDAQLQPCLVDNRAKAAVKNLVAAVGDKGFAGWSEPRPYHGAQSLERRPCWLQLKATTSMGTGAGLDDLLPRKAPPRPLIRLSVPRFTSSAPYAPMEREGGKLDPRRGRQRRR